MATLCRIRCPVRPEFLTWRFPASQPTDALSELALLEAAGVTSCPWSMAPAHGDPPATPQDGAAAAQPSRDVGAHTGSWASLQRHGRGRVASNRGAVASPQHHRRERTSHGCL